MRYPEMTSGSCSKDSTIIEEEPIACYVSFICKKEIIRNARSTMKDTHNNLGVLLAIFAADAPSAGAGFLSEPTECGA